MVDNGLSPHGGELIERVLTGEAARQRVQGLPEIPIREPLARECMNIALGFFSPLQGFLNRPDLHSVVENMRLASGYIWSVPVVLDMSGATGRRIGAARRRLCVAHLPEQPPCCA